MTTVVEVPSAKDEVTVEGTITKIVYAKERFRIVKLKLDTRGQISVLGQFPMVGEQAHVRVTGIQSTDPKFGEQIKATSVLEIAPNTLHGLALYLGGGSFPGVGKTTAQKIVAHFGDETLSILDTAPERLKEVAGLPAKTAEKLRQGWQAKSGVREIMIFMRQCGVGEALAERIWDKYRKDAFQVVRKEPYRLAREVNGVGFLTADQIGRGAGIAPDSLERMTAAVYHVIERGEEEGGDTCLNLSMIDEKVSWLLGEIPPDGGSRERAKLAPERLLEAIKVLLDEKTVISDVFDGEIVYYRLITYEMEKSLAERIWDIAHTPPNELIDTSAAAYALAEYEGRERELRGTDFALAPLQRQAVLEAAESSVLIITGGPGTGKTTILKAVLNVLEECGLVAALASPTGRAAQRMREATGKEAKTIHRLLRYSPEAQGFRCDRRTPVAVLCEACKMGSFREGCRECHPYDVVIIDEVSMLDLWLAGKLAEAVPSGGRLILVGDADQLPSVGAGCVLRDLIESGVAPVVRLNQNFRQESADSLITVNAHRVLAGEMPHSDPSRDFVMLGGHDGPGARKKVVDLVGRVAKKFPDLSYRDVQVLVPQKKGDAGMVELNRAIQEALNPAQEGVEELFRKGETYRGGDRVMQLKNDYENDVVNGQIGYVERSDKSGLLVRFEDENGIRDVPYGFKEMDNLRLAYASTTHKSQGSEFPIVIVVLLSAFGWMLTKNLFYTAITRGRRLVVVVTDHGARAVATSIQRKGNARFTRLEQRIRRIDAM